MKKRILSLVLGLAMVVAAAINPMVAYAAEPDNYLAVAGYRNQDGENIAPDAPEGKVFAGWYKDEALTQPWGENITAEKAYAKWVPQSVLGVKYQMTSGTTVDSWSTDFRFVTTVDSVYYKEVGFVFEKEGAKPATIMSDTVYEKIYASGSEVDAKTAFGEPSAYFMAVEITNMSHSDFATEFAVYPTWTTLDGTTVTGVDSTANVAEKAIVENPDNGLTFENVNEAAFIANRTGTEAYESIERIPYAETSIADETDVATYGEYGLKGTDSKEYHSFTVNCGTKIPAGSTVKFRMYIERDLTGLVEGQVGLQFQFSATTYQKLTTYHQYNDWFEYSRTLADDCAGSFNLLILNSYVKDSEQNKYVGGVKNVYIDNIEIVYPASQGLNFESASQLTWKFNVDSWKMDTLQRVHYADTTIASSVNQAKYGDYVLRATDSGLGDYRAFHINMPTGTTLAVGTTISFDLYVEMDSTKIDNQYYDSYIHVDGRHQNAYQGMKINAWGNRTYTITKENSYFGLFFVWNGTTDNLPKNIYIDNIVITPPEKPTSLTVTLYDSQNSVYGFTFNTTQKPLNPVIQIKKQLGTEDWSEYPLSTVSATSYNEDNSVLAYYISKTTVPLEANSTYIYRAYDKGTDIGTDEVTLETKNPKADSFTFVHVSDTQEGPKYFKRVLSAVSNKADFLLHTGDMVQSKYEYQWTEMLDGNFEYLSRIPTMAISGNHEADYGGADETYKHFNNSIPAQASTKRGYFYSFVYGNVKFIMLNTNDLTSNQLKPEQYDWLVNELKTNTCKWTVVALHNPLYSVGKWGADSSRNSIALALQTQLRGIFAQYGVDIVLQAHDHTISRTFPINGSGIPQTENIDIVNGVEYSINPSGVIYVMNGTAGSQARSPYAVDETLYAYGRSSQKASWAEFTFEGDMLTVTVKYHDGASEQVYYTWGIKKSS